MPDPTAISDFEKNATTFRAALAGLREIVLGNIITVSETPSPTFGEEGLAQFIVDRFCECELASSSVDEAGNAAGLLPGTSESGRTIMVTAHADKIWDAGVDHTVSVGAKALSGCSVADNSVGVAALVSLPLILDALNIRLKSDLLLVATAKSMGRGDLEGMRFFLDNTKSEIVAGICMEGIHLGRLSYSTVGMLRGELGVHVVQGGPSGVINPLSKIVNRILAIETPQSPGAEILLGSIDAGSGYNEPPMSGFLRFEIRSEDAGLVERVHRQIQEIVDEFDAQGPTHCSLDVVARRQPGKIGFTHPLVKAARDIMKALDVQPQIAPSISDLSALLDRDIPGLTLGITKGSQRHTRKETIEIDPIYTGLAQIVSVLQFIDEASPEDLNSHLDSPDNGRDQDN